MSSGLPRALSAAITAMLTGVSRTELAKRAARMSAAYRDGAASDAAITDTTDALAYLVTRMPATYAAIAAAIGALQESASDFAPRSLLDVGAGPGTGAFAATAAWPNLDAITTIDSNRVFTAIAARLFTESGNGALAGARQMLADARRLGQPLPKADVVIAAYTLAETGADDAFVAALWQACTGALVLVEPGTPDGFARIRMTRETLIATGASIAAPCPHALACPIVAPDWCHFAERLPRSRDHRLVKAAEAPFEDEKFSYVVAVKPTVALTPFAARVLAPPHATKAGIELKLCTEVGTIIDRFAPRRDKAATADVRRLGWGDAVALDQSDSHGPTSA